MGNLTTLGAVCAIYAVALVFTLWRGRTVARRWARSCRYEILHLRWERPWWSRDLFWAWSRGQPSFYVVVQERDGHERRADVVCGNWIGGVLVSDEIRVHWL